MDIFTHTLPLTPFHFRFMRRWQDCTLIRMMDTFLPSMPSYTTWLMHSSTHPSPRKIHERKLKNRKSDILDARRWDERAEWPLHVHRSLSGKMVKYRVHAGLFIFLSFPCLRWRRAGEQLRRTFALLKILLNHGAPRHSLPNCDFWMCEQTKDITIRSVNGMTTVRRQNETII